MRALNYTISDIDVKIKEYANKLEELKVAFLQGATLQTRIITGRMERVMEHIQHVTEDNGGPDSFRPR